MSPRAAERSLWTAAALAAVAAVGVGVWLFTTPPQIATPPAEVETTTTRPATSSATVASSDVPWSTPLRRPLVDPPPSLPTAVAEAARGSALGVVLTGTIIETGDAARSKAVLEADGSVVLRGVGETVAGAEVIEVAPGRATLRLRGRTIELEVPRHDAGGGA